MDCKAFQDWLLGSEDRQAPPADMAEHLHACAPCRRMAQDLDALEDAWRATPPIADPQRSQQEFLARLSNPNAMRSARRSPPARALTRRLALAAAVFVAVALGSWILLPDRQAEASSDVISRLVDWNLDLTQTGPGERSQVYARDAGKFRTSIAHAHLRGSEADLANTLLSTAESLSKSDDALAHLDEFRDLADRLEELIEQSLEQEDYKRADLLARQYRRIAQSGLTLNLQRAEASGALHLDRPGKLEKIILTDVSQAEALARLLEKSPNLSRQEIREALSIRKEHANRRRQTPAP
jgi:hypothetical protein